MRFHLIAPPNVQTTKEFSLDGFGMATIRFAKLLKRLNHRVFLYASEQNEAPCDELITVVTKAEQTALLAGLEYQYAPSADKAYPLWAMFNARAAKEIGERKQPRDFICMLGGTAQQAIAVAHSDLITVEYSIGYIASFSKYRVYESQYWRAWSSGAQGNQDGRFWDDVIPLFFDPTEFTFRWEKEPFALFVGRLTPNKGLTIACQAAAAAGIPLKVIGHGDTNLVTHGAEYLGALDMATRNEWMSRASALICPTTYIEPFGSTAVEAQMCGTPVVSTDFGGFVETVEHGRTGYRCNYLGEFAQGLKDAAKLNSFYIHQRALELYSIESAAQKYQRYFDRLMLLWDKGWNTP